MGVWGPCRGPITCDDDPGAPPLRRDATSDGGVGGHVGPPSPATMIQARHRSAGARRAYGGWGPCRGPITCDADRGAPRLRRGATSVWGGWGPCQGPITCDADRGAPPLRRGATSVWGGWGPCRAPMKMDEFEAWFDKGVTDGLPVVPPTRGRVEAMLAATRRARDELLGEMPPNY